MNPSLNLFQNIGWAVLALVAVVVGGWFAIVRIRAWMKDEAPSGQVFSLDDLRRLHRAGQLSDEEFERAKEMMIGSVRKAPSRKEPPATEGVPRTAVPGQAPSAAPTAPPVRPKPIRPAALGGSPDRAEPEGRGQSGNHAEDGTHSPKSPKRPPQLG